MVQQGQCTSHHADVAAAVPTTAAACLPRPLYLLVQQGTGPLVRVVCVVVTSHWLFVGFHERGGDASEVDGRHAEDEALADGTDL